MKVSGSAFRKYGKWVIILLVLVAATAAGVNYFNQNKKPVTAGATTTVGRGDILSVVSATGTISAVNSVDVSSKITGLITEVLVKENDMVKAGQVMILLDDTSLKAQVTQIRSKLINARSNYDRSRKMAAGGAISAQQLDTDETNYNVSQADYDDIVSKMDDTIIKAPIDGLVVGKPIPAGQTVAPGISNPMVLLTVADMSKMQIQVQVDETDIGRVQLNQKVNFTVDAYPGRTFTGNVSLISKKATIQQNVVYYSVYVDVDSAEGLLFPTMTARVTILVGESKNVLTIPLSAVKDSKGQKVVQVMMAGKAQNTVVKLGIADDEKVEVVSGLNEGDQVLLPSGKASTAGAAGAPNLRSIMGR
ncbi:MAG TPA: efflux RND transporter periplasmic adaptor subunit [Patescibacteria group bacterium]|nr:efflux RND transporter periplasmic adaptor subunit [Patescibacteria group bacterium]